MPLPTTNLTLNLDASDTDNLFTTWVNGGSHTGTPGDGDAVQVWRRETDGSVSPCNAAYQANSPVYRSGTPLMLLPCLDFDGTNAKMTLTNNDSVSSFIGSSSFFSTTARAIVIAFYAESITAANTGASGAGDNHGLFSGDSYWTISLRNDGGQRKAQFAAHDGAWKMAEVNISEATSHVLCARHDNTNLYISVDGGAETSTACGTIGADPSQVIIGSGINSIRLNGRVGQIATYSSSGYPTDAIAFLRSKWQGVGGSGTEALAGSAITPGHGTQTPGISISI
jgi:hypothetical protein